MSNGMASRWGPQGMTPADLVTMFLAGRLRRHLSPKQSKWLTDLCTRAGVSPSYGRLLDGSAWRMDVLENGEATLCRWYDVLEQLPSPPGLEPAATLEPPSPEAHRGRWWPERAGRRRGRYR